ncbi:MAG: sulfatase [Fimbriimonadaceae bacterium]|nr:sulfatase [Fimbriimonadaceae bacterium]
MPAPPTLSRRSMLAGTAALAGAAALGRVGQAATPPNVLFMAVDDLRPEMGCYGVPGIRTPHLDRLAAGGTVFDRAYCQQAVCSPSRTSLLTGCRPDTTQVWDLETHFRRALPEVVTLPQHFKSQGYYTQAIGKIFHGGLDDAPSWSAPPVRIQRPMYQLAANREIVARRTAESQGRQFPNASARYNAMTGPATEAADVPDDAYADGQIASEAVRLLQQPRTQPLFLAVGFLKPHLPFIAPQRYWDLYQRDQIPPAPNPFAPQDAPPLAMARFGELRAYSDIPRLEPLSAAQAQLLKHGYYACVSYVDAQIGRLLDELDRSGQRQNTIIVLWGDHGWKLGEHGEWCKHTNFENDTRGPLLVTAPGLPGGQHTAGLVEFVDLYPSLCELAGLPLPPHLEGSSFVPLARQPQRAWKTAAFSQYPRGNGLMGYSLRTDRYRFTRWQARDGQVVARELYDHQTDPQENVNLATRAEHQATVAELARQLTAGWQAARPRAGGG